MEIGIDIEENERFKDLSAQKLERIFTLNEIKYAKKYADYEKHLCAFWCAKEALIKALSEKKIPLNKIEISHQIDGKPFYVMNEIILETLKNLNLNHLKLSFSHAKEYSIATCLAY